VELLPADEGRHASGSYFPLDVDGDALGDLPLTVEVGPARLRVLA
jgi:diacylglycerol kinase family enzyme